MDRRKFAVIVGDQVMNKITIQDISEFEHRQVAAMLSNPIIIETDNENVGPGWLWDGTEFTSPGA